MIKREPLQSAAYFGSAIKFRREAIAKYEAKFQEQPLPFARPDTAAASLLQYHHSLLTAEYSCGYPVAQLASYYPTIINSLERLLLVDTEGVFAVNFKNGIDNYVEAIWLLSQAYLLGMGQPELYRIVTYIGNEGQDLLFEKFASAIVPGLKRRPARKLLYSKAYQPLYDAISAPVEQQPVLMQQFLRNWYGKMRDTGWYDAHKSPNGGGFDGYWCWEAAGVAVAFGIDDASFCDMPYYPKDLADFARTKLQTGV